MNPDSLAPEPMFSALLSSLLQRTEEKPCSELLWLCQNRIKPPRSRGRGSGGSSHLPFWCPPLPTRPTPAPEPGHHCSPICCPLSASPSDPPALHSLQGPALATSLLTPEEPQFPFLVVPPTGHQPATQGNTGHTGSQAALPETGRGSQAERGPVFPDLGRGCLLDTGGPASPQQQYSRPSPLPGAKPDKPQARGRCWSGRPWSGM